MAILTIKLSTEQRDVIAPLIVARLAALRSIQTGEASLEAQRLREALRELTERARDYAAESSAPMRDARKGA